MSCKVWEEMLLFCIIMNTLPPESEPRAKFWLDLKHLTKKADLAVIGSGDPAHFQKFREKTGYDGLLFSDPSLAAFSLLGFARQPQPKGDNGVIKTMQQAGQGNDSKS